MKHLKNYNIKPLNWFNSNAIISDFYIISSINDILNIIYDELPIIIGNGSNVLIDETIIDNKMLKLTGDFDKISIIQENSEHTLINVGCGVLSKVLSEFCAKNNLTGLEFLYTIPGTIGGNIKTNAGCYGSEISEHIQNITCIDNNKIIRILDQKDIIFNYREMKCSYNVIFLYAQFLLKKLPNNNLIYEKMKEMEIKRQETQPVGYKTCGSTFKNPKNCQFQYAWQVIDAIAMRGFTIENVMFSEKHCNFIIILKNIKSNNTIHNIKLLIKEAQKRAFDIFNISLELEIQLIE